MLGHLLVGGANPIGILGVVLVLVAYVMLQLGLMPQDTILFSFLNFLGSIFILYSLYFHWNTASVVIEVAWLIISFYGLVKSTYAYYKQNQNS